MTMAITHLMGECDDPRFEGMAVDGVVLEDAIGTDATDCRVACEFGLLGLRDYGTGAVKPKFGPQGRYPLIISDWRTITSALLDRGDINQAPLVNRGARAGFSWPLPSRRGFRGLPPQPRQTG